MVIHMNDIIYARQQGRFNESSHKRERLNAVFNGLSPLNAQTRRLAVSAAHPNMQG